MDIKIKHDELRFKYRVGGIIINDNKVMMVDNHHNNFWCLPGGHVHIGENTVDAIKREIMEETSITYESAKLVAIVENFYKSNFGKKVHELSFNYLLENTYIPPEKTKDYTCVENDDGNMIDLEFKWIPLSEIDKYDIRPKLLKKILKTKDFRFQHKISNE